MLTFYINLKFLVSVSTNWALDTCDLCVQIALERNGKQVHQDLLKIVLNFFLEIREGKIDYYITFEQLMLEEAASYYSQLALELLCCISYADYIQKVVLFHW